MELDQTIAEPGTLSLRQEGKGSARLYVGVALVIATLAICKVQNDGMRQATQTSQVRQAQAQVQALGRPAASSAQSAQPKLTKKGARLVTVSAL